MPVTPEYEWSQTDEEVVIEVDIKGITRQKMDVFATDAMVKVVAHPYVLIVDLLEDVDADVSTAYTQPGHVTFRLKKRDRRTWDCLNHTGKKAEREARRNTSIEAAHAAAEDKRKAHVQRLKDSKTAATHRQIDIDKKKRQAIEAAKAAELQCEREKLQRWQDGDAEGDESDCEQMVAEEDPQQVTADPHDHPEYYGKGFRGNLPEDEQQADKEQTEPNTNTVTQKQRALVEDISTGSDSSNTCVDASVTDAPKFQEQSAVLERTEAVPEPVKLLPPPRPGMQPVEVEFTKLEFPHLPAREKREQELKLYKKTQEDAMRTTNSIDISDRQPIFLKDKGDSLYAQGNFHAAVNAYSIAIERGEEDSTLSLLCRMNRAACHSKVSAHGSCITDCDHVAELLQKAEPAVAAGRHPDPEQWKRLLVKALTRRSAAQAHIGEVQNALEGCEQALALDPESVELQSMQKELEASAGPADWEGLQQRATARHTSKQYAAAAEVYAMLAKRPGATTADAAAALSNQGMCLLSEQQYCNALGKCEAAVLLATGQRQIPEHTWVVTWLQQHSGTQPERRADVSQDIETEAVTEAAHVPEQECMKKPVQAQLVLKNLGRMASCRAHLKEFRAAAILYQEAAKGARNLALEAEACAFEADAEHMGELEKEELAWSVEEAVVEQPSEPAVGVALAGG